MSGTKNKISLEGNWSFSFDPEARGISEGWFNYEHLDTIILPGTTDENKKGNLNINNENTNHLTQLYPYIGKASYQRRFEIPEEWKDKQKLFFMERTKESYVWVDEQFIGSNNSLAAPHQYEFKCKLAPGNHKITVMIDNDIKTPAVNSHQLTENTQTNWNGILGRIELIAVEEIRIDDIQIYPDVDKKKVKVEISVNNSSGSLADGVISLEAESWNHSNLSKVKQVRYDVTASVGSNLIKLDYCMGEEFLSWDEFSPAMYNMKIGMELKTSNQTYLECREVNFGMRKFTVNGTQFEMNGKKTFLRGKHDACVFPLTGYAPMNVNEWIMVLKIAKEYGINHYRFHTWCPPEAAFEAADIVGIYMQPELPGFGGNYEKNKNDEYMSYILREGLRIIKAYGNHPSFVMFALGNEIQGSRRILSKIVQRFRSEDPRHLYAQGSNNDYDNPSYPDGDDYWTTMRTDKDHMVRGSFSHADLPLGHIQTNRPSTLVDYDNSIKDVSVPVIGHEVGQYQVYPNYNEISKYKGVLYPYNLEAFRKRLADKGMVDLADDFSRASGALSLICYREDIETAMRTNGFGGFQLLDLQDFPGQGTALIGILDAFMDSKGLIEPEKWREFCSDTVLLSLMEKYIWTTDETFSAEIKVLNYGPDKVEKAKPVCTLKDSENRILCSKELAVKEIVERGLISLGRVEFQLKDIKAPEKLTLEIQIEGTNKVNHYSIWIYPEKLDIMKPDNIIITRVLDEHIHELFNRGAKILFFPEKEKIQNGIEGSFTPDFWNYRMFSNICKSMNKNISPGTMGILCNPEHAVFNSFPTEYHTNWQWWDILMNSRAIILDDAPSGYRPIVQVIDNIERNHKLGIIFEAKVGKGKLLVCSSDLPNMQHRPEAKQLMHSLMKYMNSEDFQPTHEFEYENLIELGC